MASFITLIPCIRADSTASGRRINGSIALREGVTKWAIGGTATMSTTASHQAIAAGERGMTKHECRMTKEWTEHEYQDVLPQGPVPFCHLRLFFSRNGKSRKPVSPGSSI